VNKGRTARMNEQANILFNISSSISGQSAGKIELSLPPSYLQRSLYAALARNLYLQEGFTVLGERLAAIARHAYLARQTEVMQEASQLMLALPLSKKAHSVAHYYQALYIWRQGNIEEARRIFSRVIDTASPLYEARGLLSTGATYFEQGEFEAALPHYLAAARVARGRDIQASVMALKMAAVIRSIYGDHQWALADLERLFPAVQSVGRDCPAFYYEFLNSYAVELGEVGRIREAQNVCAVVIASPFAKAYPEFTQTRDELEAKRITATPSVVAMPATVPEVIAAPEAQAEPNPEPAHTRSTISLKLKGFYSPSRTLAATPKSAVILCINLTTTLERLSESTLPRGPPALS
jgi:tetratricopeptide (TPR) repeat protein